MMRRQGLAVTRRLQSTARAGFEAETSAIARTRRLVDLESQKSC
jgi:hypothetical protein